MATVSFLNESYECSKAIKGSNYIHLLDENGVKIATFDGIKDFAPFSITGGEWSEPAAASDCHLAVVREDGTVVKSDHKFCDLLTTDGDQTINGTLTVKKIIGAVYA